MPKLTRKTQKLFGETGGALGQFGSAQTGVPNLSTDLDVIQGLVAYSEGWNDAVIDGDKRPPLEEFNGIKYVNDYQNAYLLQEGIAEYDVATSYYNGSLTKQTGTSIIFKSLINDNLGQALVDGANWKLLGDLADLRNANKLQDFDISTTNPNDDEYLRYNGTASEWQPYHRNHAAMQFETNATATTITTINTPVKVLATYLPESLNGFTHATGRLTYTGAMSKEFNISLSSSLYTVGSNDKLLHTYLGVNGSIVLKSGKSAGSGNNGEGTNIASNLLQIFNTGDYIEAFVENNENIDNIVVVDLYMIISEL